MKKLVFLLATLIIIFIIYKAFDNKKLNFLSIGDFPVNDLNLSRVKKYDNITNIDFTINELTSKIYNNKEKLKTKLASSSIVLISIGERDLTNILSNSNNNLNNYNEIDSLIDDYKAFLNQVNKYARGNIVVMGVYNNKIDNSYVKYFNNKLRSILDNDITYIDFNEYLNSSKTKREIINIYVANGRFDF